MRKEEIEKEPKKKILPPQLFLLTLIKKHFRTLEQVLENLKKKTVLKTQEHEKLKIPHGEPWEKVYFQFPS